MGYSTPSLVDLKSFWPYKKDIKLKFVIRKILKFLYENSIFFLLSYSKNSFRFRI